MKPTLTLLTALLLAPLAALATLAGAVHAADLVPFPVNWKATAPSPADLSGLLDAPAGHAGFVTVKDGHFVKPDGSRLRFWGINATGAGALPTHANADLLASGLARRGINCVRLHLLDTPNNGLFPKDTDNTLSLDPARLDRLDYFVAALKRRGIYVNLNLNVLRQYLPGDGVRDAKYIGTAKKLTYFDARLLELQRDYARQLLTHLNPYTKTTYANEPAVALIEFVNENSLIAGWFDGGLDSIPRSYANDLTAQFNAWLARHADAAALAAWRQQAGVADGAPLPRLRSKEIATADRERFHTEARFYLELERDFFFGMAKFLRDELRVRSLFTGTSDHAYGKTGLPHLAASSVLDVVDGHKYWQHPSNSKLPAPGKGAYRIGSIGNSPMVDDPLNATVIELSRSAFAGKPFIVTEANHPFPNEFAAEGIPILAAYGALQDWDGIFYYSLIHADLDEMDSSVARHFDLAMDPGRMAQFAPGALLFLRGDVAPARTTHTRTYTREQVIDSIRLEGRPYYTPGFPKGLALTQAVRIGSLDGPPTGAFPAFEPRFPLQSDTRELTWHYSRQHTGLVTIDTPLSQAAMGFIGANRVQLAHVVLRMDTPFSAVTLSALDDVSIARARRLLLTATARTANTGQVWKDNRRTTIETWGGAPACTEPVRGQVTLRGLSGATKLTGTALDADDQPAGEIAVLRLRADSDEWTLDLNAPGAAPAISWIIEVTR